MCTATLQSWVEQAARMGAFESLCGSIPRYSIGAMSETCLVMEWPSGGADTPRFYGKAAEPNQLQAEGLAEDERGTRLWPTGREHVPQETR